MLTNRLLTRTLVGLFGVVLALTAIGTVRASDPNVTEIAFETHTQAGLPEQDVFILSADDPNSVMRVEGKEAADAATLAKPAYAAAKAVDHDPFKMGEHPLGPF